MTAIPPSEQTALIERLLSLCAAHREGQLSSGCGDPDDCQMCNLLREAASALLASASREQQALRARDQYDEERRAAHQEMCGWKGRAEAAEAQATSLREALTAHEAALYLSTKQPSWKDGARWAFQIMRAALHASPAPKGGERA